VETGLGGTLRKNMELKNSLSMLSLVYCQTWSNQLATRRYAISSQPSPYSRTKGKSRSSATKVDASASNARPNGVSLAKNILEIISASRAHYTQMGIPSSSDSSVLPLTAPYTLTGTCTSKLSAGNRSAAARIRPLSSVDTSSSKSSQYASSPSS